MAEMQAKIGTCAFCSVVSVVAIGAFLDWGFTKDLFVPASEQKERMQVGESVIVYIYRDGKTDRIAASTKLDKYLDKSPAPFKEDDKVNLLIADQTDMGYKAIINGSHWGLLYKGEVFQALRYGQAIEGFIRKIRDDGKIDLYLQKGGPQNVDDLFVKIMAHLKSSGGFSPLSDKTPPETVYQIFGVSKKKFKMAIGMLYKKKLISIDDQGIKLIV